LSVRNSLGTGLGSPDCCLGKEHKCVYLHVCPGGGLSCLLCARCWSDLSVVQHSCCLAIWVKCSPLEPFSTALSVPSEPVKTFLLIALDSLFRKMSPNDFSR
jgi:hypothetical protein